MSAGRQGARPLAVSAPAGTRLLIVDDHPVNLAMLKRQLKVLGLEADTRGEAASRRSPSGGAEKPIPS